MQLFKMCQTACILARDFNYDLVMLILKSEENINFFLSKFSKLKILCTIRIFKEFIFIENPELIPQLLLLKSRAFHEVEKTGNVKDMPKSKLD